MAAQVLAALAKARQARRTGGTHRTRSVQPDRSTLPRPRRRVRARAGQPAPRRGTGTNSTLDRAWQVIRRLPERELVMLPTAMLVATQTSRIPPTRTRGERQRVDDPGSPWPGRSTVATRPARRSTTRRDAAGAESAHLGRRAPTPASAHRGHRPTTGSAPPRRPHLDTAGHLARRTTFNPTGNPRQSWQQSP